MRPALYVDFDGVMHPVGAAVLNENSQLIPNPRLFCWRPYLEEALASHPEVKIVVSSDWRKLFSDEALMQFLGPHLGPRFVGVVELYTGCRAEEILADATRRGFTKWLAIDDHETVRTASKHDARFIACTPEGGLSSPAVQRALKLKLAKMIRANGNSRIC